MRNASAIVKFLLFLSIGMLLVWVVVKDITAEEKLNIKSAFEKANYFWIILSMILIMTSHWSRAVRWKMLLEPLGHKPRTSNTFFAIMVGYLANLALPRLGEVSRCGILNRYEKISFEEAFGTVIAERAIDMLCLIIVFFLTLLIEFATIYNFTNEKIISPLKNKLASILHQPMKIIIVLFIGAAFVAIALMVKKKMQGSALEKLKTTLLGFWNGLKAIKNIKSPGMFITHSVFIWFVYYGTLHLSFLAFDETSKLGVGEALSVLIFGTLGIIFVPGGTGAYQALVMETLKLFAISFSTAFAFAWTVWASQIIGILILGVISLILLTALNKKEIITKKELQG